MEFQEIHVVKVINNKTKILLQYDFFSQNDILVQKLVKCSASYQYFYNEEPTIIVDFLLLLRHEARKRC